MNTLKIAFRNIFRNSRRSLMTVSAIALGTTAIILFGQFVNFALKLTESAQVRRSGHLTIYRKGYFLFGAGSPNSFGIHDYQSLMSSIADDPIIKTKIKVMTPNVNF